MFGRRLTKSSGKSSSDSVADTSPLADGICDEWDAQLDRFGQGNSIDTTQLEPLPASASVEHLQRLARCCFGAQRQRFQRIDERFLKTVKGANDWRIYELAIVHIRSELRELHNFILFAPLPDRVATALITEFHTAVEQLQDHLDEGAKERARATGDTTMLMATRTRLGLFDDASPSVAEQPSPAVPRTIRLEQSHG